MWMLHGKIWLAVTLLTWLTFPFLSMLVDLFTPRAEG